jgi:leucyl/phenylalanyl-tRNA--protein transferase
MSADDLTEELKAIFSNPRAETMEGVLVAGGRMSPELLIFSYEHGVFPWPHEGYPLLWFCPEERGVIDFDDLHLPKSFKKWLRQHRSDFNITINKNFAEVLKNCRQQKRRGQKGSWINNEVEKNYNLLNQSGYALSLEVWRDEKLLGGIYGVESDKYFSSESMFHLEDNISKLALYELIIYLQTRGHKWLDIQMVTEVCESFGGKYISKLEFLDRIGR